MNPKPRPRVGCDLDDVICDFVPAFTGLCHEMYGTPKCLTPVDWGWSNYNLSKEQIGKVWERIFNTRNFWETLHRCPDASVGAMHRLRPTDLFFITARSETVGDSTHDQCVEWIKRHFYGAVLNPCVLVGIKDKGALAAALRLDYFVDDYEVNCLSVADAVPTCKVYLKDRSHNRSFSDPRITRIASFNEFTKIVGTF